MHFLTEDDIRTRCPNPGCSLTLGVNERLTPSAAEFVTQMRVTVERSECPAPQAQPCAKETHPCAVGAEGRGGMTYLDAATLVPKSHPRIMLRGKLDTLLAATVLAQTQFDSRNRLSPYLKECLADVADWIMHILTAEVSGGTCDFRTVGGMDAPVLCAVSRDPQKYLGLDPFMPSAAMGANAALLNWLRALARETEVAAARSGLERADIAEALNVLSSAVYVLVLLTLAAEKGLDVTKLGQGK